MTSENAQGAVSTDPAENFTPPAGRKRFSIRRLLSAWAGALALGVLVPSVLTWMARSGTDYPIELIDDGTTTAKWEYWNVDSLFQLMFMALAFCGPGIVIITLILYVGFRKGRSVQQDDEGPAMRTGVICGAAISWLNFPALLVRIFLDQYPLATLRVIVLFLVTGATCGGWIAWQAYREAHPERRWFPRFTMGTLLVLTLSWGLLLMIFMPLE